MTKEEYDFVRSFSSDGLGLVRAIPALALIKKGWLTPSMARHYATKDSGFYRLTKEGWAAKKAYEKANGLQPYYERIEA